MADEAIGKGRRAIFGGPKPEEIKHQDIKGKGQEDKSLSLKVESQAPATHHPEENMPKADKIKPDMLELKDKGLNIKAEGLNLKALQQAISNAKSSRKTIAVWSPVISAALWYLKATIPMFSISEAARAWVEAGLERDHPELMKRIKEEMGKT
jgi:hypothetical protein